MDEILSVLHETDPVAVNTVENRELYGPAAMFLLHQFRCTVRFVDDLTSGPNPYTKKLLYCFVPGKPVSEYSVLGGLIKGIYPGQFLELEATPGRDMCHFSTLDVEIVTRFHRVPSETGEVELVTQSLTKLYDKRRNACYRGIPIVQYAHVSSTISLHCGYNILIGQLHRFRELILMRSNYVTEVARLIIRMQKRGYKKSILLRKLKHHLRMYPDTFGDRSFGRLWDDIQDHYQYLLTRPDWEFVEPAADQMWSTEELVELQYVNEVLSEPASDVDA